MPTVFTATKRDNPAADVIRTRLKKGGEGRGIAEDELARSVRKTWATIWESDAVSGRGKMLACELSLMDG